MVLDRTEATAASSQAGFPAESTLAARQEETTGAPAQQYAQGTGTSISAGSSLHKPAHHSDICD